MLPWLRSFNYIEDYFRTLYQIYAEHYVASYPVTYYSTDMDNSVVEKENLNAGSYEKGGVGELSGMKWKKIRMLPVFGVNTVQMQQETGEKGGMTFRDGSSTQVVFPSLYGLIPIEGDVVDLSFGYRTPTVNTKMLFTVNNINPAHQGDFFQIYQLQLKMAGFSREELDKQVSSDWMFYEHEHQIVPLANGYRLLRLQERSVNMSTVANRVFDKQSGFYLGG